MGRGGLLLTLVLASCGGGPGYGQWPDPQTVFPYVYTPEQGLHEWADVRFETETWDPAVDWDMTALMPISSARCTGINTVKPRPGTSIT